MKYLCTFPIYVDARQWDPGDPVTTDQTMSWLAFRRADARFEDDDSVSVIDAEGDRTVAVQDDWLVGYDDGRILVLNDEDFRLHFQPVE